MKGFLILFATAALMTGCQSTSTNNSGGTGANRNFNYGGSMGNGGNVISDLPLNAGAPDNFSDNSGGTGANSSFNYSGSMGNGGNVISDLPLNAGASGNFY
jgi:hypothetical protein